ncbi:MAG: glycoside hydrolase family 127 protein [Acidobacteria bacterium]|nr:glycoside hydrolase family 127 protein [Acidobacteriota bacterium]
MRFAFRQWRVVALLIAVFLVACYQSALPDAAVKTASPVEAPAVPPPDQSAAPIRLTRAQLLNAAQAGGDYLLRMQKQDGSFHYLYDPEKNEFPQRRYNILRHAGTTWSLFQLYKATHEARYLLAARLACRFLQTTFRAVPRKAALYVLDFDGKAKLGANGLALLVLTKQLQLDAKNANREAARGLAHMILALQRPDGAFASYHRLRGDEPEGNVSLYYPGEAILGLVDMYQITGDQRLLQAARRAADYLVDSQRRLHELPPDAWLMQALEALHNIKPQPQYFEHTLALADAMVAYQYSAADAAEYAGGFAPGVPRATPAASRAEGILAAYRLAKAANDKRAAKFADALKAAARFQLSQQFTDAQRFHLPNLHSAQGGFRESLEVMRIRIDYVQHNISALLGIADTLY